ncbi:glycerol-3-phosphate dehydrogenase [Sinobaca qinghaiensis]|uniref:Glycerol-3-phosphate dehydrogenase n=1 Tax=Sinobaca qinghaiensis TaxID=342944 RepID=A0A419V3Z2_9BACL|nr:NAD(P)/FAD-dependent oxidoreductase [Sinobaca qinghaiensis]RKD73227.1 glycerol-3-phosphate dehydrogenase [Sinobaca qinghaiensis]
MIDFLIIGGGVIGTALARELSHCKGRTVLLEKGRSLSGVQSTHNSALVHPPAMMPPDKGKLKSVLGKKGSFLHQQLARHFDVPVFHNGAIVTARTEEELQKLHRLKQQSEAEGIDTITLCSREELLEREPNLHPDVKGGLFMPEAMSADTSVLTERLAANARLNGAEIYTNTEVTALKKSAFGFEAETKEGRVFQSRFVINAAGAASGFIAGMIEDKVPFEPVSRRGEYLVLSRQAAGFINHIIYPPPTSLTKGVLIIPQPDGTIRLGPTDTQQKDFRSALPTKEGIDQIRHEVNMLAVELPYHFEERYYAGIRSSITDPDFYIRPSEAYPRLIHLAGLDSPGVTASPAVASYVLTEIIQNIEPVERKTEPNLFGY